MTFETFFPQLHTTKFPKGKDLKIDIVVTGTEFVRMRCGLYPIDTDKTFLVKLGLSEQNSETEMKNRLSFP